MSLKINDKRERWLDDKMDRYIELNDAPLVNGVIFGNGPVKGQTVNYGVNDDNEKVLKPITDILYARPYPKQGFYKSKFYVGDFFKYLYRFEKVEDGIAVYTMNCTV